MPQPEKDRGEVLLEWTFPEFIRHDRSRNWYLGFAGLTIAMIGLFVLLKNFTFVFFIILATLILMIRLRRVPPDIRFAVREEGIEVGGRFYPWSAFEEFWIVYRPPTVKKLYLHFKGPRPALDISLENENPLRVRQFLSEHLPENAEREDEPFGDQLTRLLKI